MYHVVANGTHVSFWVHSWDNRGKFTWTERGFNAGQTHRSMYPSIFNRLWAIARYWSEIATFSYPPLHLTPPLGCSHWNSGKKFGPQKTRIMGLPGSEDSMTIGWAVSTQYQRVMERRTIATTWAVWLTHVKNVWRTCTSAVTVRRQVLLINSADLQNLAAQFHRSHLHLEARQVPFNHTEVSHLVHSKWHMPKWQHNW